MVKNCCNFSILEEKALDYALILEEIRLPAREIAPTDQTPLFNPAKKPDDGRGR